MKILYHPAVRKFLRQESKEVKAAATHFTELLAELGHTLSMPYAKPVGSGLWELRLRGRHSYRILYGFQGGEALLLHAFKKSTQALRREDIELARKRLDGYRI